MPHACRLLQHVPLHDARERGRNLILGLIPNPHHRNHETAPFERALVLHTRHYYACRSCQKYGAYCRYAPFLCSTQPTNPTDHTSYMLHRSVYFSLYRRCYHFASRPSTSLSCRVQEPPNRSRVNTVALLQSTTYSDTGMLFLKRKFDHIIFLYFSKPF